MSAGIQIVQGSSASTVIDAAARISPRAEIGPGCVIGPYAVVGEEVRLGPGCRLHGHAVVEGPTTMGGNNEIHSFACIGGAPQDLRHRGEPTELLIGEGNVFREMVTVNRGTVHGGGRTVIGDRNLFMAYTHIAHDCRVGSRAVFANHATLAGHASVEDYVVFGGMVAVGTFLRIGESAMLAAGAMIERDVAPYCMVSGDRARLRAINRVGLTRRDFSPALKARLKAVCRALKDPAEKLTDIVARFREDTASPLYPEVAHMLDFIESATRGLVR